MADTRLTKISGEINSLVAQINSIAQLNRCQRPWNPSKQVCYAVSKSVYLTKSQDEDTVKLFTAANLCSLSCLEKSTFEEGQRTARKSEVVWRVWWRGGGVPLTVMSKTHRQRPPPPPPSAFLFHVTPRACEGTPPPPSPSKHHHSPRDFFAHSVESKFPRQNVPHFNVSRQKVFTKLLISQGPCLLSWITHKAHALLTAPLNCALILYPQFT